jgi:hypothetical protein
MKNTLKTLTVGVVLAATAGCSALKEIEVRDTKAQPDWYMACKQVGSEGVGFTDTHAYSCGMGQSRYEQASEAQAYAFAIKGFAERLNGTVTASTVVDIKDDTRTAKTHVEHSVVETAVREHLEVQRHSYELKSTGMIHTYVRIKMPLNTFNTLLEEAKNEKRAKAAAVRTAE